MRYGYLLTPVGRTSRLGFWRAYLAGSIIAALAFVVAVAISIMAGWWGAPFFLPMLLAEWIYIAAAIRRLHDRGRSGWWYVLFFGPAIAVIVLVNLSVELGRPAPLLALLMLPAAGLSIWGWVDMGFLKGRPGANRFGPEPTDV